MKKSSLVLYSNQFKGFLRIEEVRQGGELVSMTLKFGDVSEATTFPSIKDVEDFKKYYCMGVNYQWELRSYSPR